MHDRAPTYDIAILSDLRYPGGNSSSIVEEVKAQYKAGYTTALVHIPAGHMRRRRSFNHKILHCVATGMATLERGPLRARLLVIRQPRLFADPLARVPEIEAEQRLLVINHPPYDTRVGPDDPYYRLDEVRRRSEAAFGPFEWAPIGPSVRGALMEADPSVVLTDEDWHNIINVDEWAVDRSRFVSDVPVIGRHSRGHAAKWPADAVELLAAYPDGPEFQVRVLGGAEPVETVLGRVPARWTVHPFGAVAPNVFLRGVDFFVYFHHPDWIEAFGRNSIEAMAAGLPVILPWSFEALFGDAAIYSEPAGVLDIVRALYNDADAYRAHVARSLTFVERAFGGDQHVARLMSRIGPPSGRASASARPRRRRVLLVASVQTDAAALTRLVDVASQLPEHLEPVFAVADSALEAVAGSGHLVLPLPTADVTKRDSDWLRRRVLAVMGQEDPDVLVVDAGDTSPGIKRARDSASMPVVSVGDGGASAPSAETARSSSRLIVQLADQRHTRHQRDRDRRADAR